MWSGASVAGRVVAMMKGRWSVRQRTLLLVLLVAGIVVTQFTLQASDKRVPVLRADLIGVWVGLSGDHLEMIRIDLSADGDGVFGYAFVDEEPCVVQLESWIYADGELVLDLGDRGRCEERELRGSVVGSLLKLRMSGDGWQRHALLKKEEPLAKRWERLRAAMAADVTK